MTEPCTYIIFGATGNLSRVKLMPALYHLEAAGKLPPGSRILALGRRPWERDHCIEQRLDFLAIGDGDAERIADFEQQLARLL